MAAATDFNNSTSTSPFGNGNNSTNENNEAQYQHQQSYSRPSASEEARDEAEDDNRGDNNSSFPRKKRRKLTADERKRAVKAYASPLGLPLAFTNMPYHLFYTS